MHCCEDACSRVSKQQGETRAIRPFKGILFLVFYYVLNLNEILLKKPQAQAMACALFSINLKNNNMRSGLLTLLKSISIDDVFLCLIKMFRDFAFCKDDLPKASLSCTCCCFVFFFYALLNSIKRQTNLSVIRHLADNTCQSVTPSQRQIPQCFIWQNYKENRKKHIWGTCSQKRNDRIIIAQNELNVLLTEQG